MKLIHELLDWLNVKSYEARYVPKHDVILLDVEEDERTRFLWVYNERLALDFALIRTPLTSPIAVIGNL